MLKVFYIQLLLTTVLSSTIYSWHKYSDFLKENGLRLVPKKIDKEIQSQSLDSLDMFPDATSRYSVTTDSLQTIWS